MTLHLLDRGPVYLIGNPSRGVLGPNAATSALTAEQLTTLASEPGLTLNP
jgi:hypothetical protein